MSVEIRQGRPEDADGIFRVLESAFRLDPGTDKWRQRQREAQGQAGAFRVLVADGQIVSVAHLARDPIQIGSCVVTKGEVGDVSTLPEFERRGLATRLMTDVVSWMGGQGCHLTRLGGYCPFYSRFGYVAFPRGLIQFPLTGYRSRSGFTDPEKVLVNPPGDGFVRPYDATNDHAARARLYQTFNANRTGAAPRTFGGPPVHSETNPWHLVFERQGDVAGCLFASAYAEEHSPFEGKVQIHEAAVDPERPEALAALLRHVLLQAYHHGATRVTARLPLDHSLYPWYRLGSLGFEPLLWHSTESSNMLRVLNLPGLLSQILPELNRRLSDSFLADWSGGLDLQVGNESVRLERARGQLAVSPASLNNALTLDPADFLYLLLGLASVDQVVRSTPALPPEQRAVLSALFPVQPTATGVWG